MQQRSVLFGDAMARPSRSALNVINDVLSHSGHIDSNADRDVAVRAFVNHAIPLFYAERNPAYDALEVESQELLPAMRTGSHLGLRGDF